MRILKHVLITVLNFVLNNENFKQQTKNINIFVDLTHISENKLIVHIMELCDTGIYTLDMAFRLS